MRRIYKTLIAVVLVQLLLPGQARAWWEYIEPYSGPGPFFGFSLDARLLCVVQKADGSKVARIPSALGVITTSCRIDPAAKERRWAAFDLGAKFVWADDNSRFANGRRISQTTLEPSMSFRLIKSDRWDMVEYGVGAGAYWFSSTEFPSFRGTFLEPARFEFHATSRMREHELAALVPRVRVGMLVYPGGFETSAFAAAPGGPPRISRDRVWNVSVLFDMEPLLKHFE